MKMKWKNNLTNTNIFTQIKIYIPLPETTSFSIRQRNPNCGAQFQQDPCQLVKKKKKKPLALKKPKM